MYIVKIATCNMNMYTVGGKNKPKNKMGFIKTMDNKCTVHMYSNLMSKIPLFLITNHHPLTSVVI